MKLNNLTDVLIHTAQDLYNAETQVVKALPKVMEAANDAGLKRLLQDQVAETGAQVQRLEQVCKHLGVSEKGVTCEGMKGSIKEVQEIIDMSGDPAAKDAALIGSFQKVKHYEIASYGTCLTFAKILGLSEAAGLLEKSLGEATATDTRLTSVAEAGLNQKAAK